MVKNYSFTNLVDVVMVALQCVIPVKEFLVSDDDDLMVGKIGGIPFYISETQHEAWKNTDLDN